MPDEAIANPILNSPYEQPGRHFELGVRGPTGEISDGRRPSESFVPIAQARKGRGVSRDQMALDLYDDRRERNSLINELRREVGAWRRDGYPRVTPISRKLLEHWADESRENRVFFCQREAVETAIFLAEVAGRYNFTDWRQRIDPLNEEHNGGLPRVALKMATGAGKTVVMAMLIAWQTLNKVHSPRDARFGNRFVVVTPGITIRDRLRVLFPNDGENYYDERDLIPPDLRGALNQAQIIVTNYHSFLLKDAKEIRGVAKNTRALLRAGRQDPFRETYDAMVTRVLRDFGGRSKQKVMVINDEAHHCYQDRPIAPDGPKLAKDAQEANEEASVWFRGVQAIAKAVGVRTVYDLSATPFYLAGSGYNEGYIFPWTVSDFSLMDAIESGIVKIPRTPVDDDATTERPTYLNLWEYVKDDLPKRNTKDLGPLEDWIPGELDGALRSLYRGYLRAFEHWEATLRQYGETPPVFIVVCPNTVVSRLVYEWIAGREVADGDAVTHRPGKLDLLSNVIDGKPLGRPRTILVDSAQLESGETLKKDFRTAAAEEIDVFKAEYRRRNPGADVEQITDEEILREVMNTVGKKGKLGEGVRCVVSVAMLTEGWDANTVTHILGIRAFGSQLLCEQVMGRGLRRRSYALNDEGRFEPEYASVYGIPFAFIPTDKQTAEVLPKRPAVEVGAVAGRDDFRIEFPLLTGYRVELPDEDLTFDPVATRPFEIGPTTVPRWTEAAGIVGEVERDTADPASFRRQQVAYKLAAALVAGPFGFGGDRRPWLFPRLARIACEWLDTRVHVADGYSIGYLLTHDERFRAAVEAVYEAITVQIGDRRAQLRPILRGFDPVGSTEDVRFVTRKELEPTDKSEVSHVTLDGPKGNTWEQILALQCERHPDVAAYVKNDHLGFSIPYLHNGRTHSYLPDFLIRLKQRDGDVLRTLIVEVSGGQKRAHSPGPTSAKAHTARHSWCVAVNNHSEFGRWGYIEINSMSGVRDALNEAIDALYNDAPITGDPDLLDLTEVPRGA